MTPTKIGPREQHLREQREQQAKEHEAGRRTTKPEAAKDWRRQLTTIKANRKRKDRRK